METAVDPYTSNTFTKKRANQKFENRENQIAFNNKKARLSRYKKAKILKILDKNRKILLETLGDKNELEIDKRYLVDKGFIIGYYTHRTYINKKEKLIATWVFDLGYIDLNNNKVKIISYGKSNQS